MKETDVSEQTIPGTDIAIRVQNVTKKYIIGHHKDETLRGQITGLFRTKASKTEDFLALNNINFSVRHGEVIGIIGKNGAGKSTLLKILSQITKPNEGRVEIEGRVASLLEVGTGFHPELTGRENIFLNGTILGMSRKEVKEKFDEIVAFSGVEKFIDTPVKHYSSGMYVRLAFAVAAHLEPEILIIDEVLAVGDAEFQKKCLGKMKDVANDGRTVLFVSHNLAAVESLCSRAILLDKGQLIYEGNTTETISEYHKMVKRNQLVQNIESFENENIAVKSMRVEPITGDLITVSSGINFELVFENKRPDETIDATFELRTTDEVIVFHRGSYIDQEKGSKKGTYKVSGTIAPNTLNAGSYHFNLMFGLNSTYLLLHCPDILTFDIENAADENGYKLLPGILKPNLNFKSELISE